MKKKTRILRVWLTLLFCDFLSFISCKFQYFINIFKCCFSFRFSFRYNALVCILLFVIFFFVFVPSSGEAFKSSTVEKKDELFSSFHLMTKSAIENVLRVKVFGLLKTAENFPESFIKSNAGFKSFISSGNLDSTKISANCATDHTANGENNFFPKWVNYIIRFTHGVSPLLIGVCIGTWLSCLIIWYLL